MMDPCSMVFKLYQLGSETLWALSFPAVKHGLMNQDSPIGTRLGLIAASYYLPKIQLSPVFAMLADEVGRKPVIAIGVFFMIAGAVLAGASQSVGMFIGSRVLLGTGTVAARKSTKWI
jgi:MFS family permease